MLQKDADQSKKDSVVLLLQDMLEVVARDMMVTEIRWVDLSLQLNWSSVLNILIEKVFYS